MNKKLAHSILLIFAFLLGFVALSGFLLTIACETASALNLRFTSSRLLLPLNNLNYDINEEGVICCYSGIYHRIQLYDSNGQFTNGWFVKGHRNAEVFCENDKIHFSDLDGNNHVFNFMGDEIASDEKDIEHLELKAKKQLKQKDINNFKQVNTIWDSTIVNISDTGEEITLIKTAPYLWPFRMLTPCFLIGLVSIGIIYIAKKDIIFETSNGDSL
ncbi:MAG: hypothetical protein ACYTET_01365 [Planctomycetota bacterium]|jgi:hypothetical protein